MPKVRRHSKRFVTFLLTGNSAYASRAAANRKILTISIPHLSPPSISFASVEEGFRERRGRRHSPGFDLVARFKMGCLPCLGRPPHHLHPRLSSFRRRFRLHGSRKRGATGSHKS